MARTKISEFSATAADNTDIDNINIAEGCAPSGINNAIREMMAQLKDFQTGSAGDPFNGAVNGTVGASTPSTVVATQVDITAQGDLRLQDTTGGQYVALQAPGTVATSYTLTLPVDDGTAGQALITDGSGVLSWSSAASGDVYGPASATDNAVARYDGTTGKIIQNSAVTIADDGATVIDANSTSAGLRITQTGTGNALLVEDAANPDATPTVITASGDLVVGHTSSIASGSSTASLQVQGSSGTTAAVFNWASSGSDPSRFVMAKSNSGTIGTRGSVASGTRLGFFRFMGDDGTAFIDAAAIDAYVDGTPGTNDMPGRLVFSTTADGASSPTERMRIDNAGRVGIGSTSLATYRLKVGGNITGGTSAYGVASESTVLSDTTFSANYFTSIVTTQATAFTLSNLRHYWTFQNAFGAGSTVTNQYGFFADASLTGATNNYGFYSNIASGTGRWNFYAAGTADNYFAGNVGIGTTTPAARLHVFGTTKIGGILVEDSNTSSAAPAIEVIGKRSDANGSSAFAGKMLLARNRTDAAISSNIALGAVAFGGNHTDGTLANILYSASILGVSTGAFSSATAMPTALVFYTGDVGRAPDTAGVTIGTERMRISETGTISLGAAPGAESLRVTPVASAVNYLQASGAIASGNPTLAATGTDTNVNLTLLPRGTGGVLAVSTGQTVAAISTATLGGGIGVFDAGSVGGSGGTLVFGAASGGWRFAAIKSFATNGSNNTQGDLHFLTRRTNSDATLTPAMQISSGGTISLASSQGSESVRVSPVASAVNYWDFVGSATGTFIGAYASGSDTNIDMKLIPKGTGVLLFGTYTAGVVTQAGYITIKDAGGTTRRLLVG